MKINKFLYLVASISAVSCCFGCANRSTPTPPKESTTTIEAHNIEAEKTLSFVYQGDDNFSVNWGDDTTVDEHNTSHIYDGTVANPIVTITGAFNSIQFSDTEGYYSNNNLIESITIGDGILVLPEYSFYNCSNLKSITVGNSVTFIGQYAFAYCEALEELIISKSVKHIGASAITNCPNAYIYCKGLSQPEGWSSEWNPDDRPYYWDCVSHDTYNDSFEYIVTGSVDGVIIARYLSDIGGFVQIPEKINDKNVVGIGYKAFAETAVEIIHISETITSIDEKAFDNCANLTKVVIFNGVKHIGKQAFNRCPKLTEIVIPQSVKTMDSNVFSNCDSLTIFCEANEKPSGWANNWNGDRPYYFDYVSEGNTGEFYYVVTQKGAIVTSYIGSREASHIHFPPDFGDVPIIGIGSKVFYGMRNLESVTLPATMTIINNDAFGGCSNLQNIENAQDVTFIGDGAFSGCSNLRSITNTPNVTFIGDGAFSGCSNLISFTFSDKLTNIGKNAFRYCSSIDEFIIPKSVETVGSEAFADYNGAIYCRAKAKPKGWADDWVDIENSTVYWDYVKRDSCDGFDYIMFSESVTITKYRGDEIQLSIPTTLEGKNVVGIEQYVFIEPSSMILITLPKTIKYIKKYAFYGCSGLRNIVIPASVKTIGDGAFFDCPSISIYCEAASKPSGWDETWNPLNRPCYWGFEAKGNEDEFRYVITHENTFVVGYTGDDTNIVIPEKIKDRSVTMIGAEAFANSSIILVKVPKTLKAIDHNAFDHCSLVIDLTVFTDCFGFIPKSDVNAFINGNCSFKVASREMAIAFMSRKGGWPNDINRYIFEE